MLRQHGRMEAKNEEEKEREREILKTENGTERRQATQGDLQRETFRMKKWKKTNQTEKRNTW